jgi:DNA repair exonuclease SbcCD ATPase subunit
MFIILLTIIVLAIVFFLIPGNSGERKRVSLKIRQMTMLAEKVGKLDSDIHQKQNEIMKLREEYKKLTSKDLPISDSYGLSDEERKVFEEKIKNQQNMPIKELLKDILAKKGEISEINVKIKELEILLPKPHVVKDGENHYQIATNFLINEKKIWKKRAFWLVERTAIIEPLVPGFKVWNFYSENEKAYGTFVTQGTANVSPNEVRRKTKKKLIDDRDNAIAEKDKLANEIANLTETKKNLNIEIENLRKEKIKLEKQKENVSEQKKEIEEQMDLIKNSLSYLVKLEENLIDEGIIRKSGFLKLGSPRLGKSPTIVFHKLDLRNEKTIKISAKEFSLNQINKVSLYPRYHQEETDYKISYDLYKQNATLTILNVEIFKNNRIIIAVK